MSASVNNRLSSYFIITLDPKKRFHFGPQIPLSPGKTDSHTYGAENILQVTVFEVCLELFFNLGHVKFSDLHL